MGIVIGGMTVSLDGFINDREGSVSKLYPDLEEFVATEYLQEWMGRTGAVMMGRHSYDMANGDFTGYEYQTPIFVVTHHVPETPAKGQNDKLKIHFVTDGVASAIQQAKAAAGDKDVQIVGGADATQQCLNLGLVDELHVGVMPVLLGGGVRLFENLAAAESTKLELIRTIEGPAGRVELIYRVVR